MLKITGETTPDNLGRYQVTLMSNDGETRRVTFNQNFDPKRHDLILQALIPKHMFRNCQ